MAVKKRLLAYIAPVDLMYWWPDVAAGAGFSVGVNPDPYVIKLAGFPDEGSIACRSGTVSRGDACVLVFPSASGHPASRNAIAGKCVILLFYSEKKRDKGLSGYECALAHEIGELLVSAGATVVR